MSAYAAQFGYPYTTNASHLVAPGQPSAPSTPGTPGVPCCESSTCRPVATDPVTGQAICSCQYEAGRMSALNSYQRLAGGSSLSYGSAYPASEQNPYPSIGVESGYFTAFGNPYGLKESSAGDMGVYPAVGSAPGYPYNPYDPSLYAYGAPYDLAARRKNATRESTGTLKAWLNEHKKNPYPTKGEKIMLAIITKMTLTQVSTWFANARRRLKKENKMTWEPKNKTDSDEEADDNAAAKDRTDKDDTDGEKDPLTSVDSEGMSPLAKVEVKAEAISPDLDWKEKSVHDPLKPKIWSLADTAVCKTPPRPGVWPTEAPSGPQDGSNSFPLPATIPPSSGYSRYPSVSPRPGAVYAPGGTRAGYGPLAGAGGGYALTGGAGFGETAVDTPPLTPPALKPSKLASHSSGGGVVDYSGQYQPMAPAGSRLAPPDSACGAPYPGAAVHMSLQQQQQHEQHMQQQVHHQQQQHQQQMQQTPQNMPSDMQHYSSSYKDGSSGGAASGFVSPV